MAGNDHSWQWGDAKGIFQKPDGMSDSEWYTKVLPQRLEHNKKYNVDGMSPTGGMSQGSFLKHGLNKQPWGRDAKGYLSLGNYKKYLSQDEAAALTRGRAEKWDKETSGWDKDWSGIIGTEKSSRERILEDPLEWARPQEGEPPQAFIQRLKVQGAKEYAAALESDPDAMDELFPEQGVGDELRKKLGQAGTQTAAERQTASVNARIDAFAKEMMGPLNANDPRARQIRDIVGNQAGQSAMSRGLGRGGYSEMARQQGTENMLTQYDMQRKQMGMAALDQLRNENLQRAQLGQQSEQFDAQMKQGMQDRWAAASRQAFEDKSNAAAAQAGGLLGVGGAVVGGYFGGPKGAEAGYNAGSKWGAGMTAGKYTYSPPQQYYGGYSGGSKRGLGGY